MLDATAALSTRQEAFCRHFVASGNAADAARRAGYAEGSARQTGHALLERPYIVERVRRIRMSWQRTARDEARIALTRLEQAWDAAAASGSAYLMLQIVRLQAEIAGLIRHAAGMRRAVLWPVAGEDEFARDGGRPAPASSKPGPNRVRWVSTPTRRGRDRAEPRPLARHGANREALERQEDFDGAAHDRTAERLTEAVEERERGFRKPRTEPARSPSASSRRAPPPAEDRPQADDPPEEIYDEDGWVGDASGPATTGSMAPKTGRPSGSLAHARGYLRAPATASPNSTTPGRRRASNCAGGTASHGKRRACERRDEGFLTTTPSTRSCRPTGNSHPAMTSHDIS